MFSFGQISWGNPLLMGHFILCFGADAFLTCVVFSAHPTYKGEWGAKAGFTGTHTEGKSTDLQTNNTIVHFCSAFHCILFHSWLKWDFLETGPACLTSFVCSVNMRSSRDHSDHSSKAQTREIKCSHASNSRSLLKSKHLSYGDIPSWCEMSKTPLSSVNMAQSIATFWCPAMFF